MPTLAERLQYWTATCTGGRFAKLNQSDEIHKHHLVGHEEGICLGISMAWLAMCRDGMKFGALKSFLSTWKFIVRIQEIAERAGDDMEDGKFYTKSWGKAWEATGFKYAGIHKAAFMFDSLGRYVARVEGAYMLKVPDHAMAAWHGGGTFRFLDPNAGQASFESKDEFWLCLARYFCDSYVATTYELEKPAGMWNMPIFAYRLS